MRFPSKHLAIALTLVAAASTGAAEDPDISPFSPFVGTTWRALVKPEKGLHDTSRWEIVLGGRALRILHTLDGGVYGGETLVRWDAGAETWRYLYVTTAGFATEGTLEIDGKGRVTSRESVAGEANGVREVESIQEITDDGRLAVTTRMLRGDGWESRGTVHYLPAPGAVFDPDVAMVGAPPATVVALVRHAEKTGEGNDPGLTASGRARAERLAVLLEPLGIGRVLSTDTRRTRDTARPIAGRAGVEVELYDPRAPETLVADLAASGGAAVVVGHSNTVPDLVERLGGEPGPPIDEASEYDRVYLVWVGGHVHTLRLSSDGADRPAAPGESASGGAKNAPR